MIRSPRIRRYLVKALVLALGGGTMFASCETRFKDSVVGGLRQIILSPDAANLIVQAIVPTDSSTSDSSNP